MTLRQRLALHYGGVVVVALLLLGGLTYHEFATERRLRSALGPEKEAEAIWGEAVEVFVYAMIPVILVGGWWLTRRSLQPLIDLAKTVEGTGIDNLREPLFRSGNGDEVDRLTAAFNGMRTRVDQSFQQVREFTLHASHELKTPLTVMHSQIDSAIRQGGPFTPETRDCGECMHSLLEEVERLAKIVDALTLLTKADAGQVSLERQPVKLTDLIRESFEDAQILSEPSQIEVTLTECVDVTVTGDRHRLRQLLLNLVDNAIKYNHPAGKITMALRQTNGTAEIVITNTGAGIAVDLQPRVFDRFVRGDEARAKASDGCGLGLTIAQWIAQAHGGTIQIASNPTGLTTVTVRLPLAE
ncbi:MAG: HAMP domain-containing sensor histidine kinase [Verrucomicrobiota bacterium]